MRPDARHAGVNKTAGGLRTLEQPRRERGLDKAIVVRAGATLKSALRRRETDQSASAFLRDGVLKGAHPRLLAGTQTYELLIKFFSAQTGEGHDPEASVAVLARRVLDEHAQFRELKIAIEIETPSEQSD